MPPECISPLDAAMQRQINRPGIISELPEDDQNTLLSPNPTNLTWESIVNSYLTPDTPSDSETADVTDFDWCTSSTVECKLKKESGDNPIRYLFVQIHEPQNLDWLSAAAEQAVIQALIQTTDPLPKEIEFDSDDLQKNFLNAMVNPEDSEQDGWGKAIQTEPFLIFPTKLKFDVISNAKHDYLVIIKLNHGLTAAIPLRQLADIFDHPCSQQPVTQAECQAALQDITAPYSSLYPVDENWFNYSFSPDKPVTQTQTLTAIREAIESGDTHLLNGKTVFFDIKNKKGKTIGRGVMPIEKWEALLPHFQTPIQEKQQKLVQTVKTAAPYIAISLGILAGLGFSKFRKKRQ